MSLYSCHFLNVKFVSLMKSFGKSLGDIFVPFNQSYTPNFDLASVHLMVYKLVFTKALLMFTSSDKILISIVFCLHKEIY